MTETPPLEPTPPPPPPPEKKRNWWLWGCLGCAGCGGLTFVLLAALGLLGAVLGGDGEEGGEGGDTGPAAVETRTFVNSPEGLGGDLAENYVPFSFNYPATWEMVENGREPDATDFVQVARGKDGEVTESFTVSWIAHDPAAVQDPTLLGPLVDVIRGQFAEALSDFRPIKMGPVTVGGRPGLEFTFSGTLQGGQELWGRDILLPGDDGRGLRLLLLATPLAESVEGPAQVGERGELPVILSSFKIGQR